MRCVAISISVGLLLPILAFGQDEANVPTVVLDSGLRFDQIEAEEIQIRGGIYRVEATEDNGLRLVSDNETLEIKADSLDLEDSPDEDQALSFSDEAGVRHVVLIRPDGSALEALGRTADTVQERSTRATRFTSAQRAKTVAQYYKPYYSGKKSPRRVYGPRITLSAPTGQDTWIHGQSYDIKWQTSGSVSDKVNIRLMQGNSLATWFSYTNVYVAVHFNGRIATNAPNDGIHQHWQVPIWLPPGEYQVLIEDSANSAIFRRSQPFNVAVREPCEATGTAVHCFTVYLKGHKRSSTVRSGTLPDRPGGWKRAWLTSEPIYSVKGGSSRVEERESASKEPGETDFYVRLSSGGYEARHRCGMTGYCTTTHFGLISNTYYLHGEPNE